MDNPFKSPAILSLCTGMRGLERGIERAIGPVRTIAYVEIEAFIIENLVQQMEQGVLDPAPVWSNVKTFGGGDFQNKIHGITGGYPCQPFSVAGNREGTSDPRHLWPYIFRIVDAVRPVWCFFENVPGHITIGFREVRSQLQGVGYKVEAGIFSAAEVGAPHQRKRLFILAVDNTHSNRLKQKYQVYAGRNSTEHAGEVANSKYDGQPSTKIRNQGEGQKVVANSSSGDNKRNNRKPLDQKIGKEQGERPVRQQSICRWPAGPTEQQYEWEAPRVESSMGYTINGYNFREDLLRMAGNGVVEQTAELAFRDLIRKHGLEHLMLNDTTTKAD